MKRVQTLFAVLLLAGSFRVTPGFAQVNAVVGGIVSDSSGALIPGVEVTARNVATGIVTSRITNEAGNYDFASLQPGTYTVSAALSGFQTATFNNVQLSQGQQVRLNFTLQVGTVAQAVEVVAEANTSLATTTSSVGNVLHEALFYSNKNSALGAQGWFQNLVGAQKTYSNRNQFGGRLGGPIKKNKAFFFVLIDEQRYVEKQSITSTVLTAPAREGIFRYLTEGATGSNGGTSRRNGNAFSTIPSVDRNGNVLSMGSNGAPLFLNSFNLFSDVRDPNRTRIDPVWVGPQYLSRMPLPNDYTVGDGLNTAGFRWLRRHPGTDSSTGNDPNTNRDHLSARVDYQLNPKNKLTYTMSREEDWGVTGQTGIPDFPGGYFGEIRRYPDVYTGAWTSTLSSTLLNEARWGLKRDSWFGWSPFDVGCCVRGAQETDIAASSQEALGTFPELKGKLFYTQPGTVGGTTLGNYAPFDRAGAAPRFNPSPLMQFADTLSWIKGTHSFQAGFELIHSGSGQNNSGGIATAYAHSILGVGSIPVPNINATNFRGLNSNDIGPAQDV